VDVEKIDIRLPGLVTSDWFYMGDKRSMWTHYFVWFCKQNALYTLYVNLPGAHTLASHKRLQGEHHGIGQTRDFEVATNVDVTFPHSPSKYGWDGQLVPADMFRGSARPTPKMDQRQQVGGTTRFSSLELDCIRNAAGVYNIQTRGNAHLSKTILVTASNYAYRYVLENWEHFAGNFGYKWLVVAMDDDLFKHVGALKSVKINTPQQSHYRAESQYRSPGFNSISIQKLVFVRDLLQVGYNVIFCDPDNIFLRDVFRTDTDLMRMIQSNRIDYVYSVNTMSTDAKTLDSCQNKAEWEGNTGFYYVSCKNDKSITLFSDAIRASVKSPSLDDQVIFWNELRRMNGTQHCHKTRRNDTLMVVADDAVQKQGETKKFTYCCMDPRKIVTGKDVKNDKNVEAYHANFAIGIEAKIRKLRQNVYGGGWTMGPYVGSRSLP